MKTKKISLLTAMFVVIASNLSFAAEVNQIDGGYPGETRSARYEFIEFNFNPETNQFEDGYFRRKNDIEIVEEHKTDLEKKLETKIAEYQKSWMPLLFKIVGTGFGINAGLSAIDTVVVATNPRNRTIINTIYKYGYADQSPIQATNYILNKLMIPIRRPLESILSTALEEGFIGNTGFDLGWATIIGTKSLLAAGIATWLFKKANSYQKEIERLQAQIATDEHMLKALPNVPAHDRK